MVSSKPVTVDVIENNTVSSSNTNFSTAMITNNSENNDGKKYLKQFIFHSN